MDETTYILATWAIVIAIMAFVLIRYAINILKVDIYKESSDYTVRDFYSLKRKRN